MFTSKLAQLLVGYSTMVQPGQVVALTGSPRAEPLLQALYREVLRAGGHPMVWMTPVRFEELLYEHGSDDQLAFVNGLDLAIWSTADVLIQVHAVEGKPPSGPDQLRRRLLHARSRRFLRELLMGQATQKRLRWTVTLAPSPEIARAALLDRDDPAAAWRAVSERQARLIDFLSGVRELHFHTPRGTDLRVPIAGRTWLNSDGHENLPDGEVFTAPCDGAAEGTVCFDLPSGYAGAAVEGVRLVFQAGRVVEAVAQKGEDVLHAVLAQDDGAHGVGEIALGCNYLLARPTGHPLVDEKIGGTFHLALGAAHPATGGQNRSALHWDLVCDLRQGGRVLADGAVISEQGRFVRPDWPQPVSEPEA